MQAAEHDTAAHSSGSKHRWCEQRSRTFGNGEVPARLLSLRHCSAVVADARRAFDACVDMTHDDFFVFLAGESLFRNKKSTVVTTRYRGVRFSIAPPRTPATCSRIISLTDDVRGFQFETHARLVSADAPAKYCTMMPMATNASCALVCSNNLRTTVARLLCTPVVFGASDATHTAVRVPAHGVPGDSFAVLYTPDFSDGGGGDADSDNDTASTPAASMPSGKSPSCVYTITETCRKRRLNGNSDLVFNLLVNWLVRVLSEQFSDSLIHLCCACSRPVAACQMALRYVRHTAPRALTSAPDAPATPIYYRSGVCGECHADSILYQLAVARHCTVDSQPSLELFPAAHASVTDTGVAATTTVITTTTTTAAARPTKRTAASAKQESRAKRPARAAVAAAEDDDDGADSDCVSEQ
jgi:hypothetical protein